MRYCFAVILALSALILAACSTGPSAPPTDMPFQTTPMVVTPTPVQGSDSAYPYPAPPVQNNPNPAYPAPEPTGDPQGRSLSALSALAFAQSAAQASFDPNARLYVIMPSQVMLTNLGSPPALPGWFYKFKVEGTAREYIIQVVNDQASGSSEAEAMEPTQPLELPINLDQVKLDSDQVYASFAEKAPSLGLTVSDPKSYDLELVNLEGKGGPIWSVVDPGTLTWLYSVNATTGEEVPNPHS
ncbi:hypothetical protein EKD04_005830 [Chloroflexales bacterium ZM16-3]|nr:hypothetical protein [Chloroflexales bacterium ZM16-3]